MLIAVVGLLVIGVLIGWLLGPKHQRLGDQVAGDQALADKVKSAIDADDGYRSLVVVEFTAEDATWTGLGSPYGVLDGPPPTEATPYELGSITKTFTAALYQEAIDNGEVSPDDKLEQYLPELAGTPAGGATLESLAQHTSGLPSLTTETALGSLPALFTNGDLYAGTTYQREIDRTKRTPLQTPGEFFYSNLGISLLGHALANAADAGDWTTLVQQRVFTPVGMEHTVPAPTAADIPELAAIGHHPNGLRAPRWSGEFYLPAGVSTFTNAADMTAWGQGLLAGTAPGVEAMEPTLELGEGNEVGRVWRVSEGNGRTITWHNGGTGGFRTMLALDREAGRGYLVMGNTARWVDTLGLRLATSDGDQIPENPPTGRDSAASYWVMYGIAALLLGWSLLTAIRSKHRLGLVGGAFVMVAGLVLGWTQGPWVVVGGWAYGFLLGLALIIGALTVRRWESLPTRPEKWVVPSALLVVLKSLIAGAAFLSF
ncbi:serine hydrolase domain-containing protein [Propionibacteriaceae bacterium Y2011]